MNKAIVSQIIWLYSQVLYVLRFAACFIQQSLRPWIISEIYGSLFINLQNEFTSAKTT